MIWRDGNSTEIHGSGCADLNKTKYRGFDKEAIQATSRQAVVTDIYPPENFGYEAAEWEFYAEDVKFHGCTKGLPKEG